jgi:hypothetical protein
VSQKQKQDPDRRVWSWILFDFISFAKFFDSLVCIFESRTSSCVEVTVGVFRSGK